MLDSTFRHHNQALATPAPRHSLRPGVTHWRLTFRARDRDALDAPFPLDIPASPVEFALQTLAFPVDLVQQEILACTSNRVIVCCCRQWGKSTTGALKALHHALTTPGALVLLASRTLRQTGELLAKVIGFAKSLGIRIRRAQRHPNSLLLPNGARIIALPGEPDSLRGYSAVSLLIVDEAAYVPDELYTALRPMLATTNGAIWLLSTPRNRTGFFFDEFSGDSLKWSKFRVTAADCPRISAGFLEEERLRHGPALFQREYFCDFGYTGRSYFDIDALDAATEPDRYLAAQQFAFGRPAKRIIVGFDLGQKESHSAVIAIEVSTGASNRRDPVTFEFIPETHFIIRRLERIPLDIPYDGQVLRLSRIIRDLGNPNDITLVLDATGCGGPFLEFLRKQKLGVLIIAVSITGGTVGSFAGGIHRVPKKELLATANYLLMSDALTAQPGMAGLKELKEEMEAFRVRTSRAGHDSFRTGAKDDLVMAYALAAWRVRPYFPRVRETATEPRP